MPCAPLRILSNDRNLIRTAVLDPSSVAAIENTVFAVPASRTGTAGVALSGAYTGAEDAIIDVEIVDTNVDLNIVSAPLLVGSGSGTITDVAAEDLAAQSIAIELQDAGIAIRAAGLDFEGVRIVAAATGAAGNNIRINIDQSPLVFAATNYSLIHDLAIGSGGLTGSDYDFDTAVLGADSIIPDTAHRIAFGEDTSAVYLQYKEYTANQWVYHFVPALRRAIPRGTPIRFVTNGRTVTLHDGTSSPGVTETYTGVETAYDLLQQIKETSMLVVVDGVVAYDRSPTGQAAQELLARTDAHVEPSTGSGSTYAQGGFASSYAEAGAPTELVIARCYATTGSAHPLAHLGAERWSVSGSVSGAVADAVSGVAYVGEQWGFLIPQKLPYNYGAKKGRFSVANIAYSSRAADAAEPPICVVAMSLGPDASDQTITLRATLRPAGDCTCTDMPIPSISAGCLGLYPQGGSGMDYSAANRTRLEGLYTWSADLVRLCSAYVDGGYPPTQAPFVSLPVSTFPSKALFEVVSDWEATLAKLDALPSGSPEGALRDAAETAWDDAVAEFEDDLAAASADAASAIDAIADENIAAGAAVGVYYLASVAHVRNAVPGMAAYGFVIDNVTLGGSPVEMIVSVKLVGICDVASPVFDIGLSYGPSATAPGEWAALGSGSSMGNIYGVALNEAQLLFANPTNSRVYSALLSDRYRARMQQVLITGGISPLGKSEASTIESGDGCWRDYGDSLYWAVVGSDKGAYAPAFSNKVYYSSRLATDGSAYYSTHEFAFQINVKCPNLLQAGDTITLTINDSAWAPTYQVGDEIVLPVVAAQDLYLAGGQDGNAIQLWNVTSSVAGPLAVYTLDPGAPAPYSDAGLSFQINQGAIPYVIGDAFGFSVEGGHYRWRVNGGAWDASSPLDNIPDVAVALYEGLSATFTPGAAPSFAAGDRYSFRVLQPWAASNLQAPGVETWKWSGDDSTHGFDLGSEQTIADLAIALHTLPSGCTITVDGAAAMSSPFDPDWTETLTWREGPIFSELATARSARYLRLTVTSAPDAAIGWFFAGDALTTTLSADLNLARAYKIARGDGGLYQGGRYLGKAVSGTMEWTEGALPESDVTALQAMLDWCKEHGDEPILIVPNVTRPEEAFLGRPAVDEVEFPDIFAYGPNAGAARRHSTTIPIAGVWR